MNEKIKKYKEDWQSLKQHETPEWLMDGKFGIYTCWTPTTIATKDNLGEWYGFMMYINEYRLKSNGEIIEELPQKAYKYHVQKYGNPKKFGFKDLIKLFQPKKFDANEWAELFKKSGAKFAGPIAMFHDNFAMWDSKVTR